MGTFGLIRYDLAIPLWLGIIPISTPIVLPANGPWLIHGIWGVTLWSNPTNDNPILGSIGIQSITGDLTPDPTPALFPLPVQQTNTVNDTNILPIPIQIHPINFKAPGNSQISLVTEYIAAGGSIALAHMGGIIFSHNQPQTIPIQRTAMLYKIVVSGAETCLGIIQLPESADLLISISTIACFAAAPVANEPLIGFIRLQSDDEALQPAEFPISFALSGPAGLVRINLTPPPVLTIPLDTQVPPGSRISVYATFPAWVTTSIHVKCYLNYGS